MEEWNNFFDPITGDFSRSRTFFPRVQRLMGIPAPQAIPVLLESGEEVVVHRFDFVERLQRHLLSMPYSDLTNLSLPNANDPWSSLPKDTDAPDYSTSTKSQWWCKETSTMFRDKLVTGHYMLHRPICFYTDKTGVDKNMRNSLEPLLCSSTLLLEKARQDCNNWFVIGYMPNLELSSRAKRQTATTGSKNRSTHVRNYHHQCLSVLLQPLLKLREEYPVFTFRRATAIAPFQIIFLISTIVGDNLSIIDYVAGWPTTSSCLL
jgi:Plavaka transposase